MWPPSPWARVCGRKDVEYPAPTVERDVIDAAAGYAGIIVKTCNGHYGLFANNPREQNIAQAQRLLNAPAPKPQQPVATDNADPDGEKALSPAVPLRRRPHDRHRDLRTRHLTSTASHAADVHHQTRHVMISIAGPPHQKCRPSVPSALRSRQSPLSNDHRFLSFPPLYRADRHSIRAARLCVVPIADPAARSAPNARHHYPPAHRPQILIDRDVAARPRVLSRAVSFFPYARPECVARSVTGRRPKTIEEDLSSLSWLPTSAR